ncbi:hypothetical protein BIU95_06075 [Curtobacterium sp. MCBA15_007]|uniref:hypothetical protein n=1 Tax=Curtobacterium TaxID=2034 RepID=UPI0008DD75F2|nr:MULTISPECIES: hypothetical protein [Curtobacterium]MCU0153246.1 hypothetical protein [Curtobacterium flaccumfaciens pv. poinsettiae]OII02307.1 hypothetical protein BIU95_06075 [Curtobacterium sp. MCBA15_007]UXN14804.1 hypothetical protein N8D76_15575 [Curtobacterium flaccumfaciens pv. poinsettiae]
MQKRLVITAVGLVLVVLPLLSGCSRQPADPIASARTLADAPDWVSTPTGTDCGEVELETDGALPAESLQCLTDASGAGDVASLAWVRRTTEGDPTPYFVQTDGAGATVASTAAYDTYGQGGWHEYGCPDIAALPGCSDEADR